MEVTTVAFVTSCAALVSAAGGPIVSIMVASRQNQAVDGKHPWCMIGSLREGASFATDALQLHGLATRFGASPVGMVGDLPGKRFPGAQRH